MNERKSKPVYVVLPVHNRRNTTEQFMVSLKRQTYANIRLILIDDGSSDGTGEMVQRYFPSAMVIRGNGRWWWGGSLHQAYKWLEKNVDDEAIVLLINDDTVFEPDFIKMGVELLRMNPRTLIQAQAIGSESGQLIDRGVTIDWLRLRFNNASDVSAINCLSTRGLFLWWTDMLRVGGFRPVLLPHYASDYEFTIRAGRKGYRLLTDETLILKMNEKTTGLRSLPKGNVLEVLKQLLSKRTPSNPFYLMIFLLLACPTKYIPINVARVWIAFAYRIFKSVVNGS